MPKVCDMGVREGGAGDTVQLWHDDETGCLVIKAFNEGGFNCTDVDLWDLVRWLQAGSYEGLLGANTRTESTGTNLRGH